MSQKLTKEAMLVRNGIDRIDSDGHYTKDNVVTACERCNKAKLDSTVDEFKNWIEKAYKHMFK